MYCLFRRIFGPLILALRHIRSFKRHQKTYHEGENVLWRFRTEDDKKKLEEIQAEELENEEEQFNEYDYEDIDDDEDEDFDDGRSMYSMYLGDGESIEDFEMDLNGTDENVLTDRSSSTSPLSNENMQDKVLRDRKNTVKKIRRNNHKMDGQKSKENAFYCPNCSKIFPSRAEIEVHIVPCAEKRAEKEKTDALQKEKEALTPFEEGVEYNCDRCSSKFKRHQNYTHHLRLCPIPYRHPSKKKSTSNGQGVSLIEKTFEFHCKHCKKGFNRKDGFKIHQTGWFSNYYVRYSVYE